VIAFLPVNIYIRIVAGILVFPFLYISVVLLYSYYQLSSHGRNLQSRIHELLIQNLKWDGKGKLLDIGCGGGSLIIKAAKAFEEASLVGIDYWGDNWEYSKQLCEYNAQLEGVDCRIEFIKASASKLPFGEGEFDAIVSCLTFHEVEDEADKIKVIKEALRVVKQDGVFVFIDIFLDEKKYGGYNELQYKLKDLDIAEFSMIRLDEMIKLSAIMKLKKVLGYATVIIGKKA